MGTEKPKVVTQNPEQPGDFHIRCEVHEHYMDFACHECVGLGDVAYYHPRGYVCSAETTEDPSDAEVFLSGSIKWDGCSNIRFDAQDDCMLHFCGREDAARVGRLIDRLYCIAASEIPAWDAELGA